MGFEHAVTVRFSEIDRAGIVFFSRVFEYCQETYEELLAVTTGGIEAMLDANAWATPIVHAEADFMRPIRLGERIRIESVIEAADDSSVTFVYRLSGGDGVTRAKARFVHAFIDLTTFKRVGFPTAFAEALKRIGIEGSEKLGGLGPQ